MDDSMFANLSQGLTNGPHGVSVISNTIPSGMMAEPAQVMVLVPNTRALEAETKLSTIKYYLAAIFVCFILIATIYVYILTRRKADMYKGKALPSVVEDPLEPVKEPVKVIRFEPEARIIEQHIEEPQDDIVSIVGAIPVWAVKDSDDSAEARVDESSANILNLVKSREQFTKDIEETMSNELKQKSNT